MSIELWLDFFSLFLCHKIQNVLACKNTPLSFSDENYPSTIYLYNNSLYYNDE